MILALLIGLCACGDKGGEPSIGNNIPAAPAEPTKPAEPENSPESTPEPTPDPGTLMELNFFRFYYDDKVWAFEEDDIWDGESTNRVEIWIPDPADPENEELVYVDIYVEEEETLSFRNNLLYAGHSIEDYANGALDMVQVGGIDVIPYGNGEDTMLYLGRVENAGVTVDIEIWGDLENEELIKLIESLEFTIPDTGNVEAPYAWEGEPITLDPSELMIGTFTLKTQQLPITESLATNETFKHNIAIAGENAYICSAGTVKQYAFEGSSFTYIGDIDLGESSEYVDAASDGSFWFSQFMRPLVNWNGSEKIASYEAPYQVAMHPSGTWGISWFSSNTVTKISISGGVASEEELIIEELKNLSRVIVDAKGNIFISGSASDGSGHKVYVYDKDFNVKAVLADEDGSGLGSVTFAAETNNGYIILDGNMRWIVLYTKDGTWIGKTDDGKLFGTDYPWFCDAQQMPDGSIVCIMTDERPDGSSDELIAFRLSGF